MAIDQTLGGFPVLSAANAANAANLVPVWRPGATAGSRTLSARFDVLLGALSRLKGEFLITDPQFGAKGDGVTDDGPAIKAAYDAAVANNGGVVVAPYTAASYRIGTTINVNGTAPVLWTGPGQYSATTDITMWFVTGQNIVFDGTVFNRTPAAGTSGVFTVQGATNVSFIRPRITGAPLYAIYCNGSDRVSILDPYVYRSYDHGIYIRDGCDQIEIIGGQVIEPGYLNASVLSGKGIGVHGISTICTNIRIQGPTIIDPNQIGLELFGNSGVTPGVQFFTISNVVVQQSKPANGNRFGISLDGSLDGTVLGCVVQGSDLAFEVAGGCKRVTYNGNVSNGSLGDGFQLSNSAASPANDPDGVTLANCTVNSCASYGIEVVKCKTLTITNPLISTAGLRGIYINDPGVGSKITLEMGVITACVKTGVYLYTTQYVDWIIRDTIARGNNTSNTVGSEGDGFYLNSDSQAHLNSIQTGGFVGSMQNAFDMGAKLANQALTASATVSLGMKWRYRIGERWKAIYRLHVQVTGGVAGLKFDLASVPTGVTGRMRIAGNTTASTATDTEQTTALTTSSATAFMAASFTGYIEIWLYLTGGTADGDIDLQMITGASAAGNIFAGSSVEFVRV